ncbi:MAG: hypothetical protein K6E76_07965 [Patescibacteria group bacterium]|nr:hypothetical protein [Patescibacteria group bacterium]
MKKTEQISSCLSFIEDYDNSLKKREDFIVTYESALGGGNIETESYNSNSTVYVYKHN